MKKLVIFTLAAAAFGLNAAGQATLEEIAATPEKAGGVYYAYPEVTEVQTAIPDGYTPFYISHYGRHGSRYLISDRDYSDLMVLMHRAAEANALTPLGLDVVTRLDSIWKEAQGRGGELSPLGVRQHRGIATRMYQSFPEVFSAGAEVSASSTVVMRCAHSMFAFIEGLKMQDPTLEVPRESGERNMYFLNYHSAESGKYSGDQGPWYQTWKRFRAEKTQPARLVASLFSDTEYVKTWIDPVELMWQFYWVAVDMQNMETKISFFDLFTAEELYNLWQVFNFNFFACNSSYPAANGEHIYNARNLVNDIVTNADRYIAEGKHGATLRFGHDGNIIPLTALLHLDRCYSEVSDPEQLASDWSDFKISPMAANLQMVFFRNRAGEILVKILLNERETSLPIASSSYPYYRWEDLRAYLTAL